MSDHKSKSGKRKASVGNTPVVRKRVKKDDSQKTPSLKTKKVQPSPVKLSESANKVKLEIIQIKKAGADLHAALEGLHKTDADPDGFNNAVREALKMPTIIARLCGIKDGKIKNEKRAGKLKPLLRPFLRDMLILSKCIADPDAALTIIHDGLAPILPLYFEVDVLFKNVLSQLSLFWATSHERLRVMAFIALYRAAKFCSDAAFERITKEMYNTYLGTCKFTSKRSIVLIQFMRTSLTEIYMLNKNVAYKQAFINIRELAVLLRSAIMERTPGSMQLVFNWQVLHSLHLWSKVISTAYPCKRLEQLIYPLCQVCLGILEAQKSPTLYPMYFHIFRILTDLSHYTNTFIPILCYIIKMLDNKKLNTSSKELTFEEIEWDYIFRLTDKQLRTNGFGDQLIQLISEHLLEYLAVFSNSIAFPELVFIINVHLKKFVSNCKVPKRSNIIKSTLEKIKANVEFTEKLRKGHPYSIKSPDTIKQFEIKATQANPPLIAVVEKIRKKNEKKEEQYEDDAFNLPAVVKTVRDGEKRSEEAEKEESEEEQEESEGDGSVEEMDVDEASEQENDSDEQSEGEDEEDDDEGEEDSEAAQDSEDEEVEIEKTPPPASKQRKFRRF